MYTLKMLHRQIIILWMFVTNSLTNGFPDTSTISPKTTREPGLITVTELPVPLMDASTINTTMDFIKTMTDNTTNDSATTDTPTLLTSTTENSSETTIPSPLSKNNINLTRENTEASTVTLNLSTMRTTEEFASNLTCSNAAYCDLYSTSTADTKISPSIEYTTDTGIGSTLATGYISTTEIEEYQFAKCYCLQY
ncbi:uncharacterized protein LOC125229152 [Leguminivora glycinivorella]|uniref:uncharacterized protein LOC125229147 n=1 Tax=Leguminivora glycinivorella TaxID=1035111 RepID=UPI00200E0CED|nr:uncharacterized protein LOC125229147 [Leguminivora glycinivorella]XP_047989887.1 uncharacterized protein LOC125229150 [Leguminivora glycinivorella]XP_047989890.1 uncharacterized protein LOC125229152 [Leguminivora glycinivorella]